MFCSRIFVKLLIHIDHQPSPTQFSSFNAYLKPLLEQRETNNANSPLPDSFRRSKTPQFFLHAVRKLVLGVKQVIGQVLS